MRRASGRGTTRRKPAGPARRPARAQARRATHHRAAGAPTGLRSLEHLPVRRAVGLVVDALRVLDHDRIAAAEVVVEPLRIFRADVDATVADVPLSLVAH